MIEKLMEMLDSEPFEAFRIIVTSGHTYEVQSPYQVAIGETRIDYFYPRSDKSAILRINQIAAFETLDQQAKS